MLGIPDADIDRQKACHWFLLMLSAAILASTPFGGILNNEPNFFGLTLLGLEPPPVINVLLLFLFIIFLWVMCGTILARFFAK